MVRAVKFNSYIRKFRKMSGSMRSKFTNNTDYLFFAL